jgi:apolipoprotein N-acyltransferase
MAGLAALSGLGVAAGQAPLQLWWVALPALAALTAIIAGEAGFGRRVWLGWLGGVGHFAGAMFWIAEPFLVEPETFGWMAPFALVLMAGGMALFWALAGAVAGFGTGRGSRALAFAGGLAFADLLRGYVFGGFPWALVGHVWVGTPVMQGAALAGAVGLTCLTVLAAALPVAGATRRAQGVGAVLAVVLLGGVWAWGAARLARPDTPRDPAIRVRLVQPNATQSQKWQPGMWELFVKRQLDFTAAAQPRPVQLVVWPETAIPWLLDDAQSLFDQAATDAGGARLAIGVQRAEGVVYYNSLAVIDPLGRIEQVYDKTRLTPFGEFIPLGDWLARFGIRAFAAREGFGYAFGSGARILDLGPAGRVLPVICYEGLFPAYLASAKGRADWILQITNDGWFGNLSGPYQHLAQMRLRAVEQGLPVLRSANTGVSAVIDAKGRLLATLALNLDAYLDADVPPALPPTLYARSGDGPVAAFIIAFLLVLTLRRVRIGS